MEAYLDNSATTRCSERAKNKMVQILTEDYGNPSSLHNMGKTAEDYIKEAKAAGAGAVGIILTGMGNDGAKGLLEMRRAGAKTIGQNEASCIVYGMPKAAYDIGAVQQQAELTQIAQKTYDCLETVR